MATEIYLVLALTGIFIGGLVVGLAMGNDDYFKLKEQAYERGYMVECLGKTGYYWECDDETGK